MGDVTFLPVWKRGATAAERFEELAMYARKHPERFDKLLVLYVEQIPRPGYERPLTQLRFIDAGCTTYDVMAICQDAMLSCWNETRVK